STNAPADVRGTEAETTDGSDTLPAEEITLNYEEVKPQPADGPAMGTPHAGDVTLKRGVIDDDGPAGAGDLADPAGNDSEVAMLIPAVQAPVTPPPDPPAGHVPGGSADQ